MVYIKLCIAALRKSSPFSAGAQHEQCENVIFQNVIYFNKKDWD